jgi:hypothetical protein
MMGKRSAFRVGHRSMLLAALWLVGVVVLYGCTGGGGLPSGGGGLPSGRQVRVKTFRGNQQSPPNFIAFQDGSGAWQIPQGSGQYTLTINDPQGKYGLVIVDLTPEPEVNIIHATVNELSEINFVLEAPPANLVTVSGTVSGLGANERALIAMGGFEASPPSNTYSLQVPPGTYDLIATKVTSGMQVNKVFIQRNISVSGNTTINIDFNSPNAFDPETHNAAVGGVSGETVVGGVEFRSHNGTLISTGVVSGVLQFPFAGIPSSKQFGNDIHQFFAEASTTTSSRRIERYFKAPIDLSVTLPAPFGNATVTVATTTPYTRLTASWDAYSGAQAYFAHFGLGQVDWFVGLSAGWLGGQRTYTLPDLSGVSGWNNNWGLPTSGTIDWEVGAVTTNRTIQDFVNADRTPVDGLEVRRAAKRGTVNVTP